MILSSTDHKIQVVLGGAVTTNQMPYTVSYIDGSITEYTPTQGFGTTNSTTAVDLITGPATGQRRMQHMTLYNADTVSAVVTVRYNNAGTTYVMWKGTLQVGDTLQYLTATGFQVIDESGNQKVVQVRNTNDIIRAIGVNIDGGSAVPSTGQKGYIYIPYACTIKAATMVADASGSAVIDVWKRAYSAGIPSVSHTITASAKPTLSSAQKSQDTTLTGWTINVAAGDIIGWNLDSISTIKRVSLVLTVWTT